MSPVNQDQYNIINNDTSLKFNNDITINDADVIHSLREEIKEKNKQLVSYKEYLINNKLFNDDIYKNITKLDKFYNFQLNVRKDSIVSKNYLILPISDVHYGEIIKSSQINNINEYNCEIAKNRILKLFNESIKYAEENKCSDLYIMFLGDIFSGNIHDELLMTNEYPISVCVMEFYEFISQLIDSIKSNFSHIYIRGVVGNHPRFSKKPQNKNKAINSYEYFLYNGLSYKFKDDNKISVNIAKSAIDYVSIGNYVWKIDHGDSYKGGSSPSGPINNILKNSMQDRNIIEALTGQKYDFELLGHFHQPSINYMNSTNVPIIVNGSILGPNEFSINNLHIAFPSSSYLISTDGKTKELQTKLIYL